MEIPARSFVTRIDVRSYELDSFGHVNHANYLNYFEFARFEAFDQCGLGVGDLVARGWAIHVVRVEVDYRTEAFLGDRLDVHTRVSGWGRSSMTLAQRAVRADDPDVLVAEASVVIVWVGENRRPMRVPEEAKVALTEGEDDASGEPTGGTGSAP